MNIKKILKQNKVEAKWQGVVFGIYFIISLIQAYSEHPKDGIKLTEFLNVVNIIFTECILVNIIGNWLMVRHPYSKKPLKNILYLMGILFTYLSFKYFTVGPKNLDILKSYSTTVDKDSLVFFFFYSTINVVITYLVAYGLYAIKRNFRIEKRASMLEKEVNEAKLTILKNQINPHFLYNTLSYMYSQARPVSENLSKSILMLSDMMRYSLNKTDENGMALIEKEIEYIENFIEIHRLRFDKDFYVTFEIEGIIGNKKIVPLLLITFVENAIKHGVLNDKNHPINIELLANNNYLNFKVKNQKQAGLKDQTSGIGLENTRNRLKLLYPSSHELKINDGQNSFEVDLKIEFN